MVRELLFKLGERGTLLDPDAVDWLSASGAPASAAEVLLAATNLPFVLTRADLERLLPGTPAGPPAPAPPPRPQPAPEWAPPAAVPAPVPARPAPPLPAAEPVVAGAAHGATTLLPPLPPSLAPARPPPRPPPAPRPAPYSHRYEILRDVTGESRCEGEITDFTRYFNDRLTRIKKLLKQRRELVGAVPIKSIRPGAQAEVKFIGMVSEVRKTKNGHRLIEIEDETGSAAVLAPASDAGKVADADTVIEDEVIGVLAKPAKSGDLLILDRFVRPDVPLERNRNAASGDALAAFISDVHIGSKTFLAEDWDRFVRWITLDDPDSERREKARRTRYLIVNGDIVDGIGIFPGQEDELRIVDGYEQYAEAGRQFARIQEARPDLRIFMLPGNHDLVRPAEPQPAFHEKYRKAFPQETVFCGNPTKLTLEGVEVLAYHGRSFDDWITRVQGLSYERPIDAMRQMMQRRHMVPIYGLRTPLAPEHQDYLVVDTVPDVFATGHVHAAGLETYRGVTLVNSSCWQSQTAYQKMHGFQPVAGRVALVDLAKGTGELLNFHQGDVGIDVIGRSQFGKPDPRVPAGDVV